MSLIPSLWYSCIEMSSCFPQQFNMQKRRTLHKDRLSTRDEPTSVFADPSGQCCWIHRQNTCRNKYLADSYATQIFVIFYANPGGVGAPWARVGGARSAGDERETFRAPALSDSDSCILISRFCCCNEGGKSQVAEFC